MGVFGTTVVTFFLAEMGDKAQIVTIALAARFHEFFGVVAGTILGMILANVPVIYLGHNFADRLPTKAVHILAAIIFCRARRIGSENGALSGRASNVLTGRLGGTHSGVA